MKKLRLLNPHACEISLQRGTTHFNAVLAAATSFEFEALQGNLDNIFHSRELSYWQNLKFEKRRQSYFLGRLAAKRSMGVYTGILDLSIIEVASGIFGQPIAKVPMLGRPELSISHCGDFGFALTFPPEHPLGIDIENWKDVAPAIIRSQLTTTEVLLTQQIIADEQKCFTLLWTAKEALSKVLKCGLTVPFEIFELDKTEFITDSNFLLYFKNFTQYRCLAWFVDKYVVSIVLPRKTAMIFDSQFLPNILKQDL